MPYLEDVVDAEDDFCVWPMRIHHVATIREVHEPAVTLVLFQKGIVLVRQRSPKHAEADVLAPMKFLDQRYAVENLAVHVPRYHQ